MKLNRSRLLIPLLIALFVSTASLPASDWPRWLGPAGDNIAPEGEHFDADLNKWNVVWKANVGKGYSSIAVSGTQAYTLGHDGNGKETVYCLNANDGTPIWTHSYDAPLMADLHTGGPNATPTIVGDKVITLGKNGQIFCFSSDISEKGKVLWKANLLEIFGIKLPRWGFASSPFIDGNQVIFSGGKVCALALETGKLIWTSKTAYEPAGYAMAPAFERDGKKFVAALDGKGLTILSDNDGSEIARHPFKALFDMNATTPYILDHGKRIFISCTVKSEMLGFDGSTLTPIWKSEELRNLMNNSVFHEGSIYGIDGQQEQSTNNLVSVKESDGTVNWSQAAIGYSTTIAIGKTLLILTERGDLITAKLDPAKYTEISRRKVLEPVCWTTPTYANGKIFLRDDHGNIVVLGR